jgi:Flp pilus assembly protein TadD
MGDLVEQGIEAITQGKVCSALSCFEEAQHRANIPLINSYFAFCIAKELGQVSKAITLCTDAISKEPRNPIHYFNLGRIYLLLNRRADAVKVFREGSGPQVHHHRMN